MSGTKLNFKARVTITITGCHCHRLLCLREFGVHRFRGVRHIKGHNNFKLGVTTRQLSPAGPLAEKNRLVANRYCHGWLHAHCCVNSPEAADGDTCAD